MSLRQSLDSTDMAAIDAALYMACYALFAHERQGDPLQDGIPRKFFSSVNIYCVYSSVRANKGFIPASQITQTFAHLMYAIRATMLFRAEAIATEQKKSIHA